MKHHKRDSGFCGIIVGFRQNEFVLFEIEIGLLPREKQTELNSRISAKLDIHFLRNCL